MLTRNDPKQSNYDGSWPENKETNSQTVQKCRDAFPPYFSSQYICDVNIPFATQKELKLG